MLLRIINLTNQEINIQDAFVVLPASAVCDFTEQSNVYDLVCSVDLRKIFDSGQISMSDGTVPLTPDNLNDYWANAAFYQDSKYPPEDLWVASPDGSRWKIKVDNNGILSTEKAGN
jgi:hypothetical protein